MEPMERIERLERRVRALTVALLLALAGFAITGFRAQPQVTEDLRVRQITVIDEHGTERVWIGAPLPDPIVLGQRRKRAGPMAGVVVLDKKGNERGGFGTSDAGEVWLGLDSETAQEARFIVNPGGGGHLTFFDAADNYARIGIWPDRPTVLLREKGRVVFEQPPAK